MQFENKCSNWRFYKEDCLLMIQFLVMYINYVLNTYQATYCYARSIMLALGTNRNIMINVIMLLTLFCQLQCGHMFYLAFNLNLCTMQQYYQILRNKEIYLSKFLNGIYHVIHKPNQYNAITHIAAIWRFKLGKVRLENILY